MTGDTFYDGLPDVENDDVSDAGNLDRVQGNLDAPAPRRCEAGEHVEPVELVHTMVCKWKQKPCGRCGKPKSNPVHKVSGGSCKFQRKQGCERCGKAKAHPDHLGAPESFNLFASGSWEAYQGAKKRWHAVLAPLLAASGLPGGLAHVLVEGAVSFGDERERDQGNHRVVIEKALGDVLVEEGYLPKDTWSFYEFGALQRIEEPGVNRLRLMLFPQAPAVVVPVQGELL